MDIARRALTFFRTRLWWFFIQAATIAASTKAMPKGTFPIFRDTGFLPSHSENTQASFLTRLKQAHSLLALGNYSAGNSLMRNVLSDVYEANGVDLNDRSYFPPNFSWDFSSNIGHIGWLYGHVLAQRVGLVPPGKRHLLLLESQVKNAFLEN